jgi:hypothetical protein
MLEVIVLGKIPGTPLQITFTWVLFGLLIALIALDIKLREAAKQHITKNTI